MSIADYKANLKFLSLSHFSFHFSSQVHFCLSSPNNPKEDMCIRSFMKNTFRIACNALKRDEPHILLTDAGLNKKTELQHFATILFHKGKVLRGSSGPTRYHLSSTGEMQAYVEGYSMVEQFVKEENVAISSLFHLNDNYYGIGLVNGKFSLDRVSQDMKNAVLKIMNLKTKFPQDSILLNRKFLSVPNYLVKKTRNFPLQNLYKDELEVFLKHRENCILLEMKNTDDPHYTPPSTRLALINGGNGTYVCLSDKFGYPSVYGIKEFVLWPSFFFAMLVWLLYDNSVNDEIASATSELMLSMI